MPGIYVEWPYRNFADGTQVILDYTGESRVIMRVSRDQEGLSQREQMTVEQHPGRIRCWAADGEDRGGATSWGMWVPLEAGKGKKQMLLGDSRRSCPAHALILAHLGPLTSRTIREEILIGLLWFPWRRKWQPTPVFLPRESMDRGAWRATVHGMVKSRTRLKQLSIERHCIIYVLVSKTICGFHNLERKYIMDLSLHSFIQYFFTQLWRYSMLIYTIK